MSEVRLNMSADSTQSSSRLNSSANADSLWERLEAGHRLSQQICDVGLLQVWKARISPKSRVQFRRRLYLAGLNADILNVLVASAKQRPSPKRSINARILNLSSSSALQHTAAKTSINALLDAICKSEVERLSHWIDQYSPTLVYALPSIQDVLYRRLREISEQILVHEFRMFRSRRGVGSLSTDARFRAQGLGDVLVIEFLHALLDRGILALKDAYPVWARLVEQEKARWQDFFREFLGRFASDRTSIAELFDIGVEDKIIGIETAGDSHRKGKTVCIVVFSSGKRLVYKPRSLFLDLWYGKFLRWLSVQEGISLPLNAPLVINRERYGWCEFISNNSCDDDATELRFYRRIGMLLSLWSFFGGNDCHHENVIANGEQAHVVDIETLFDGFGGENKTSRGKTSADVCASRLSESVKRVGFLPRYKQPNPKIVPFDVSALGVRTPFQGPFTEDQKAVEDAVSLGLRQIRVPQVGLLPNIPRTCSEPLGEARRRAVEIGYAEVYDFVQANKNSVVKQLRKLSESKEIRVRVLIRETNVYGRLIYRSLSPKCLSDGALRSIEIDRLSLRYIDQAYSTLHAEMLRAELLAVEELDIPLFDTPITLQRGQKCSCDSEGRLSRAYNGSPLKAAIKKVLQASGEDKRFQLALIRETLIIDDAIKYGSEFVQPRITADEFKCSQPPSSDEVQKVISQIEARITETALYGRDGSMGWLAPAPISRHGHYEHNVLGPSLYGGSSGISIFYAALYKVTNDARYKSLAEASLLSFKSAFKSLPFQSVAQKLNLLRDIYSLSICDRLLGKSAMVAPGLAILDRTRAGILETDTSYDVLSGSAGIILSLVALSHHNNHPSILGLARHAADHLLAHRVQVAHGFRTWKTQDVELLGFAHGTSGIALALQRLAAVTRESAYSDAAAEALSYERSLYNAEHGNWPDLRPTVSGEQPSYEPVAWCHGATGIGLANLALHELSPESCIRDEISKARRATMTLPISRVDNICCGSIGRALFLDILARRMGDADAGRARDGLVSAFLKRGVTKASLIPAIADHVMLPGLFNGLAGIGYELLRMYGDSDLPVFALWE